MIKLSNFKKFCQKLGGGYYAIPAYVTRLVSGVPTIMANTLLVVDKPRHVNHMTKSKHYLITGIPGLFFLIWQGVSGKVFLQTRDSIHAPGERDPCLSTVCEKTLPPIPASLKVRKIAGIVALIIYLSFNTILAFGAISVEIEPKEVQLGEALKLIIPLNERQTNLNPDLKSLTTDFVILGTASNMSYTLINGKTNFFSQLIIKLTPKKEGNLIIPPIIIGKELTIARKIKVGPHSKFGHDGQQKDNQQKDLKILTKVNKKDPYVNEEVIYTVKLYNSHSLFNTSYTPPQVEDALLVVGTPRQYQIFENNQLYNVEEQNYAIFPQKSGSLKIKPPALTAQSFARGDQYIQAPPIILTVRPQPAHQGKHWLPAKSLLLKEKYNNTRHSFTTGTTLVRTVILEAKAVPAELLPELDFASSEEFSTYPTKPKMQNKLNQNEIVGTSIVKVSYLLNKSGQITIPPLKLPWFNTITGKEEVASLPSLTLEILGEVNESTQINKVKDVAGVTGQKNQQMAAHATSPPTEPAITNNLAWAVAGVFCLAWLLTIGVWCRQIYRQRRGKTRAEITANVRLACLQNNPSAAKDAILQWALYYWPDADFLNLTDLIELLPDSIELKNELQTLSTALYKDHSNNHQAWQGIALWNAVLNFKYTQKIKEEEETTNLPPIYPSLN